jgi:hypothetical protein
MSPIPNSLAKFSSKRRDGPRSGVSNKDKNRLRSHGNTARSMPKLDLSMHSIKEDKNDQKSDGSRKNSEKKIPGSNEGKNKKAPKIVESLM